MLEDNDQGFIFANIIPYYDDINEFIASVPLEQRTQNPFFYCLRLKEDEVSRYKPPFRRGFYYVALLSRAERTKITFDNTSAGDLNRTFDGIIAVGLMFLLFESRRKTVVHCSS